MSNVALCDYFSIPRPEYTVVDESPAGACFAAKFPPTEMFLSRVGSIGLTAPMIEREHGKETCAANLELFLMEQVENGTFELQEEEVGHTSSGVGTVAAIVEIPKRTKRLRVDDSAIPSLDDNNQVSVKAPKPPAVFNQPHSPTKDRQLEPAETEALVINAKSNPLSPACIVEHDESKPSIIKRESLERQLCLFIDEYKSFEPVTIKQEHSICIERSEETKPSVTKQEPDKQQLAVYDNEVDPINLLALPHSRVTEKGYEVRRRSLKAEQTLAVQVHEEKNVSISKRLVELGGQITFESANLAQEHLNFVTDEDIDELFNENAIDRANEANPKKAAASEKVGQMVIEAGNGVQAMVKQELEALEMSC